MTTDGHDGDWSRLGQMLERRRVELDPRYANLSLFCREKHLDYRLCWDLEHAARENYRRATLIAVEYGYGWEPGSAYRILAGGEPEPAALTASERAILRDAPAAWGRLAAGREARNG